MREAGVRGGGYVHPGGEGGVTGTSDLSFSPFTHAQRREQDRRLQPVIAAAWEQEGGPAWWRRVPEVKETHQRLAQSYRVEGTLAWADYIEIVLAMTWAASGYFVPVDFWPFVPPPAKLDRTGHLGFEIVLNTQREAAGVFSPDNLHANKHYGLLLAHLIWCPDHIDDAAQLMAPLYPWPFVLKRDEVGILRLERQEDIGDSQWPIAERIERRLFKDAKQVRVYGVSAASDARQEKMTRTRLDTGRVVDHLYDELRGAPDIWGQVKKRLAQMGAWNVSKLGITDTEDNLRAVRNDYRASQGLPPAERGRPRKQ